MFLIYSVNFSLINFHTLGIKSLSLRSLFFLSAFGILSACQQASDSTADTAIDSAVSARFLIGAEADSVIGDRKYEQVPAIAAGADGKTLYVAWYSGGDAPGPGNYVTVSVSPDQGNTWLNDQLVVYPKESTMRFFDPALWRDKNGQVHLFYGSAKDSLLWDGFGGVNSLAIDWNGSAITYKDPQRIADGVMSNKPIYLASSNMGLFPIYVDKPPLNAESSVTYPANGAFILSHNYETSGVLKSLSPYSSIELPDSIRIHDEPQLVEISDQGDFLALLRTTKGIYSTNSSDYGKTWSEPVPFTASGPTTSSRFYIGRLASGNLLLVANNSTTRNRMTAQISKDGGKTWPYQLLLDERENVSYPDADQTPDGNIHVVFDRDRTGAKDILYFRFNEEDALAGNTQNIFRARVNK